MGKISIIIPVYNAENCLRECLDSVLRQTYTDYEVILVNDGSKDSSEAICQEYADKDERFRLISGPNHGSSGARNIGLDHVTGDHIAFLDSDDWYDDDYLEVLMEGLVSNHADIYFNDLKTDGKREHDWAPAVLHGTETLFELLNGGCCNRIYNKLYTREVVGDVRFPEGRDLCEDEAWTSWVLERVKTAARGDEAKYNVRLTENSISRSRGRKEKVIVGFYRNTLERCQVFLRNYPSDPEMQKKVIEECDKCLKRLLDSGLNLDLWDTYAFARQMVLEHSAILAEHESRYSQFFKKYDDYKKCDRGYMRNMLLSRSTSMKRRKELIQNHVLAAARRRMRK